MSNVLLLSASMLALALAASPAGAYTLTTGSSLAIACYDASYVGRSDQNALRDCNRALEEVMDPQNRAATLVNRGVIHSRRGDQAAAMADFEAAVALSPAVAEGHTNRGAILLARNDFQGAITAISRGLDLDPAEAHKAHFNRAIAYEELQNYRAAYDDYRRAAELAPNWEPPRLELARFRVE